MNLEAMIVNERDDFNRFLEELVELGFLEDAPLGIAKKVIADGIESLSDKQRHVFEKQVIANYATEKCSSCHSNVPWSEMMLAHDNDGLCGYCLHRREILEKE